MPSEKPQNRFAAKLNVNSGAVDSSQSGPNLGIVKEILETPTQPEKKVGRPKGPARTKKTLYFYHPENIEKIKKALAKTGDLWIDEESEIVDLALAVVARMVSDASEVKTITSIYEAEIKPASQK